MLLIIYIPERRITAGGPMLRELSGEERIRITEHESRDVLGTWETGDAGNPRAGAD